jgi:hypothetical protein
MLLGRSGPKKPATSDCMCLTMAPLIAWRRSKFKLLGACYYYEPLELGRTC